MSLLGFGDFRYLYLYSFFLTLIALTSHEVKTRTNLIKLSFFTRRNVLYTHRKHNLITLAQNINCVVQSFKTFGTRVS